MQNLRLKARYLVLTALHDDGFYFLTIARSIAGGAGPTFDGLAPTNGFHPLWAYALVPIFLWDLPSDTTAAVGPSSRVRRCQRASPVRASKA